MSRSSDIHEAFGTLRELCDPRGHGLLDALENLCIAEALSLDAVVNVCTRITLEEPTNVIPLIKQWSVKA